ncbi:3152_t:CDS:2 [Ambispora gerdemannii]|uniref:3152_t:CDS:1 n=1 Tax=Ambispora gerdemannii TaxID=144530 RepID=A0A9N9DM89_9GLOM|nr:3152_t:CDS:2 [Ambispora gerdemannii]
MVTERISELEDADDDLLARIKKLEDADNDLKVRITKLELKLISKKNRKFQNKCIQIAMEILNEGPIIEYRLPSLNGLEFDAFFQKYRIALEVQGSQHRFHNTGWYKDVKKLEDIVNRDRLKRNETIVRLKEVIKEKKLESYGFNAQKLKLWKVQLRIDSDEEIELHDDQLIQTGAINSYFTNELLCKYIHIIVRPPTPPVKFDLVCNLRLLKEGGTVEYVDKNRNIKATLCEGLLCTKDEKYSSFTEFIRATTGLKPNEKTNPIDFRNLKINNMTYEEVRDLIYKLRYSEQYDSESEETSDSATSKGKLEKLPNIIEIIPWNEDLEDRLCKLYVRDDIVDIFWGRNTGETTWSIYVVTHDFSLREWTEEVTGQLIHFIPEGKGFLNAGIPPQSAHDPLPTWEKVPQDLQKVFDKALDNELGPSFRKAHYNLVGMSTGYKKTQGKFTEKPAIILYVRQKGILRRGCGGLFPEEICGYPVDVVEACVATSYGLGVSQCQAYQENVELGSSIGVIEPQRTSGTLGAVVRDKNSKQIGILSCEHVCKFSESNSGKGVMIHQPSHEDLDELKQSFVDLANKDKEYKEISEVMCNKIKKTKQNSILACYKRGMRSNFFSQVHQKDFGIDTAFCISTNKNRTLCPNKFSVSPDYFKKTKLPENICLNGFYTYKDFDDIDEFGVFKVGRKTGLTCGKLVPISVAVSIDLTNESIKFAKTQAATPQTPPNTEFTDKKYFIGYMKLPLFENRQKCYPAVWFDRQLVFYFITGDFKPGDSGASVVDQKGKALGILHASWMTKHNRYAIASPYFAVFEALDVEFEETSSSA